MSKRLPRKMCCYIRVPKAFTMYGVIAVFFYELRSFAVDPGAVHANTRYPSLEKRANAKLYHSRSIVSSHTHDQHDPIDVSVPLDAMGSGKENGDKEILAYPYYPPELSERRATLRPNFASPSSNRASSLLEGKVSTNNAINSRKDVRAASLHRSADQSQRDFGTGSVAEVRRENGRKSQGSARTRQTYRQRSSIEDSFSKSSERTAHVSDLPSSMKGAIQKHESHKGRLMRRTTKLRNPRAFVELDASTRSYYFATNIFFIASNPSAKRRQVSSSRYFKHVDG